MEWISKNLWTIGAFGLVLFFVLRNFLGANGNIELVSEKLKAGALVVDVRTEQEYASGHFPGAKNIPVNQIETRLAEFGAKNTPIVVYCASGGRSSNAKAFLNSKGFVDVTNAGGLSQMPKQ